MAKKKKPLAAGVDFYGAREVIGGVMCPVCQQPPGKACVRSKGGKEPTYTQGPMHWTRIRAFRDRRTAAAPPSTP